MSSTQTQTQTQQATASLSLRPSTPPSSSSLAPLRPLRQTGILAHHPQSDNTPVIGRTFHSLQLSSLIEAPNSDELLRELAVIISERGVAFFKNQDITIPQQKVLGQKLGELSGKPKESTLHVHPITEETSELGDEISVIDSDRNVLDKVRYKRASSGWHTDISFEPYPSDYAILKIHTLPETGGDTLWASAYEQYDRLTPAYASFLEGLTAVHDGTFFHSHAAKLGNKLREGIRGHPQNSGPGLTAIHPVIRTNPVTGWKGVFVNRNFTKRIVELSPDESETVLNYLYDLVSQNHDLQVRYKWSKNDVAIWSNTSVTHTATYDYTEKRTGDRVVSIGERPFFHPDSRSRRDELAERQALAQTVA